MRAWAHTLLLLSHIQVDTGVELATVCAGKGVVAAVVRLDLVDALALLHIGGRVVGVWARHVVDEVECGG